MHIVQNNLKERSKNPRNGYRTFSTVGGGRCTRHHDAGATYTHLVAASMVVREAAVVSKGVIFFFSIYSLLLLVHNIFCFRLQKPLRTTYDTREKETKMTLGAGPGTWSEEGKKAAAVFRQPKSVGRRVGRAKTGSPRRYGHSAAAATWTSCVVRC